MPPLDLHAFVSRSAVVVDSTPPATKRDTRLWLIDPFLETLGWTVHADSCVTDTTVDETPLEYVCSVGGIPALFVAVEAFDDSLNKSRAVALLEAMAWTGVDRAIYTNGRDFLLLAGTTDIEQLACRRAALPDHEPALTHYSRDASARRLKRHSREFVARQLAVDRPTLVETISAELMAATEQGDAYRTEFESATDRFLEQLVASFADTGDDQPAGALESDTDTAVSVQFSEREISDDDSEAADRRPEPPADSEPPREDADGESTAESATPIGVDDSRANGDATVDDDTEYVVRFFNDRGSIGAIGHSSSDQALHSAAAYLFDRGLSGLSVPWQLDDAADDQAVLNDSPTHPDGTSMIAPQQLSNGLYLETGGTVDERAARVEALAARAGLRAMLTGDWERA
ncbi:hypothetical protein [Natronorubrum sulfidifaciens]|uniref:Type I restriction enzyme R protein N-terminal domain-containing protein n=1 Tax=Natronorubrum sulfidifaciens JCM 14089 TaxID=1230460 RepID=L9W4T1_9EURY|nr:hypothetical protein [Natronorubrum sulfidifaciens]ELY44464.1 hypothetical protein C495_11194 [Natronorubrum sulfidifaciens JCM 14089]